MNRSEFTANVHLARTCRTPSVPRRRTPMATAVDRRRPRENFSGARWLLVAVLACLWALLQVAA